MHLTNHRSIEDIFPPDYMGIPLDSGEVRTLCLARLETGRVVSDLYRWIEKEKCPFRQEALVIGMFDMLEEKKEDEWDDSCKGLKSYMWEEIYDNLDRIYCYAQTDQLAYQWIKSKQVVPAVEAEVGDEPTLQSLQMQFNNLQHQFDQLLESKTLTSPLKIRAIYTAKADEKERDFIEMFLRGLCTKRERSITAEVKRYLRMKQKDGYLILPLQLSSEYEMMRELGYPYTLKTYKNCRP